MRLFKMFGLAAIAAVAAMAFIASTASAETVCEENVGHKKKCPAEKSLKVGETILGLTEGKTAELLSVSGNVKCESTALGEIVKNEGEHKGLEGLIHKLLFTECEGFCEKATALNLPYKILADAKKLHVVVEDDGKGKPAALLEGCSFFKVNCKFELKAASILLDISGDTLTAKEEELEEVVTPTHSGLCPTLAKWDGKYLLTLDKLISEKEPAVYLTALP